ncbi:Cellulose synthase catalytic subunit [UDP-forming] [Fundidesulfovibrio magnetotacticus]|uniref:cellulose synthase (UDP-forming) n=1 Tax=Fundidesulfovibrio magnetotacticus TaxID=2730080 RepID=A0A6V8LUX5_9BACT|nr:glycosyltransferase family 2 protein [Fundidesulfovibrio magnetotacticus]GFK94118.1 Cellulose synthase catalytic subunit [UDP-forming] [Fundidesulfovibrio magnetotacticus]
MRNAPLDAPSHALPTAMLWVMGLSTVGVCVASGLYLTLDHQRVLGWSLAGSLYLMSLVEPRLGMVFRVFFLALGVFISLRYMVFRTTETLIFTGPADFAFMMLLYLSELYGVIIHFLGMFVNVWRLDRKPAPLPEDQSLWPTVDIFIPTYNEPDDVIFLTAQACALIDYPREKLAIYILDDGGTLAKQNNPDPAAAWEARDRSERLRHMCDDLGIRYLTRERNLKAKAGNINSAFMGHSYESAAPGPDGALVPCAPLRTTGELILILDCDHVPTRDILRNTVGFFLKDPKLFLVQTPHYFLNPTPVEKNLQTAQDSPGENEMFYGAVQLGLDFWNASFFCGSAAVLRRSILEPQGGISGETITEDAETALGLHAKGYNSVYINKPMISGLSPETFADFILQRSRWAQGMTQIFLLKNPLMQKGLTFEQKLCYFNSCFFWFFGVARFFFFISPFLYLCLGLRVYNASMSQIVAYALPHLLASYVISNNLFGQVRHPFFSELFETIQSFYLLPAILAVALNPRKPSFKVTPKGVALETDFLSHLSAPFYFMLLVCLFSFLFGVYRWTAYPMERDAIIVTVAWNFFNLMMLMLCLGVVWEKRQIRRFHRFRAKGLVMLGDPDSTDWTPTALYDLSLLGMGMLLADASPYAIGDKLNAQATDSYGHTYTFRLRIERIFPWGGMHYVGTQFIIPDDEAMASVVAYVHGDSARFAHFARSLFNKRVGLLTGFYYLIAKSFLGTVQNIQGIRRMMGRLARNLATRALGVVLPQTARREP